MHFTRAQLGRLHRQFFHPSASKLFPLLKKACAQDVTPETLKILQHISKSCNFCKRIRNAPKRFRVSFGAEHIRFNKQILMDRMYINEIPILHILDEGTHFPSARLLYFPTSLHFLHGRLSLFARPSFTLDFGIRILADQGSAFRPLFVGMAGTSNVNNERAGIAAHTSLGIGEIYHQPFSQTCLKVMAEHPNSEPAAALARSVKAMSDALKPEDLFPSALVFGENPQVHTRPKVKSERTT